MRNLSSSELDPAALPRIRPIFVHAMWRTGSTYIWNKFREQRRYRAYYEPLHEIFIDASSQKLEAAWSDETTAVMRHPHLEASYFEEYAPLIRAGGSRFGKGFPYRQYCLEETEENEPLRRYLADLLILALANGQTPVLQFNRSLLRAGWLTRHFDPVNILLLRRPIDVWKSFISFENRYFPTVICMIAGQDRRHPLLEGLAGRHGVPFFEDQTWEAEYDFYREYASANLDRLYPLFYELYLLTSIYALRHADCVIDLNEISENAASRQRVTERLGALGIQMSLDDCRLPVYTGLTEADQACLAYEPSGRDDLKTTLPPELLIPPERLEMQQGMIGGHFQEIFSEFAGGPETAMPPITGCASSAEAQHREGLRLFEEGRVEEAAARFREALLEAPAAELCPELWNDWASAQLACQRPELAELGYRQARCAGDPQGAATANLAALLARLDRRQEAIPLLELALRRAAPPEAKVLAGMLAECHSQPSAAGAPSPG